MAVTLNNVKAIFFYNTMLIVCSAQSISKYMLIYLLIYHLVLVHNPLSDLYIKSSVCALVWMIILGQCY